MNFQRINLFLTSINYKGEIRNTPSFWIKTWSLLGSILTSLLSTGYKTWTRGSFRFIPNPYCIRDRPYKIMKNLLICSSTMRLRSIFTALFHFSKPLMSICPMFNRNCSRSNKWKIMLLICSRKFLHYSSQEFLSQKWRNFK